MTTRVGNLVVTPSRRSDVMAVASLVVDAPRIGSVVWECQIAALVSRSATSPVREGPSAFAAATR